MTHLGLEGGDAEGGAGRGKDGSHGGNVTHPYLLELVILPSRETDLRIPKLP